MQKVCEKRLLTFGARRLLAPFQQRTFLIKTLDDVRNENMIRVMPSKACESRRYFTRKDGLGFSFHQTVLYPNRSLYIHYLNHLEAVFITKGSGWVEIVPNKEALGTGVKYELKPGTAYALDDHESHWLGADNEPMECVCAFTPPCDGAEFQNENGVFPFIGDDGEPKYEYWKERERARKPITIELKRTTPQ